MGLNGPGGYLVLVGPPAAAWRDVAELVPGVGLVAVNPPADVADEEGVSVLRGGRLPLKTRSMRGVVLGAPFGGDPAWVREAARVVLPGLRVVGEGGEPPPDLIEVMASAAGCGWGRRGGSGGGEGGRGVTLSGAKGACVGASPFAPLRVTRQIPAPRTGLRSPPGAAPPRPAAAP